MAKLTLSDILGQYASVTELNANFDLIEAAIENTLSRDGTSPNTMSGTLDMNSQRITNLPAPVNDTEPLRKADVPTSDIGVSTALNTSITDSALRYASNNVESALAELITSVSDISALKAVPPINSEKIYLEAHATEGDQGFGTFRGVTGAAPGTYVDNDGSIIVPTAGDGSSAWLRDYSELVVKQFGAKGDGITDDASAVQDTDAVGHFTFTSGTYKISSNTTISNQATFLPGAKLSIDTGVTVTFSEDVIAPEQQIFSGLGDVAGLDKSHVIWFTSYLNTSTDAITDIQNAYDACNNDAEVFWPTGYMTITGATAVNITKGQKTKGKDNSTSSLRCSSVVCSGLSITTRANAEVSGMTFLCTAALPTSGTMVKSAISGVHIHDIIIEKNFTGVSFEAGASSNIIDRFTIRDSQSTGLQVYDTNDVIISNFFISALNEFFDVSSLAGGPFTVGETITGGTSTATGTVISVISDTSIRVAPNNINFTATETITGGTSAATATLDTQNIPHDLGGIRLRNKAEAVMVSHGDILGGKYALITGATSYTKGNRPAYSRFNSVYFDSADNGTTIDNSVSLRFTDCWFSNRPVNGCKIVTAEDITFNGGGFINCWQYGCQVLATAIRIRFNGCSFIGNNVDNNNFDGLRFEANTNDFVVQGCTAGGTLSFGTQRYGVIVATGTSDRYIIADNLVSGNVTAGVLDNGSGANKRVADNY